MDFFGRQEQARRLTHWLVALYVASLITVIAAIDAVVLTLIALMGGDTPQWPDPQWLATHPLAVIFSTLSIAGVILFASLYRHAELRAGGGFVALALGGQRVLPDTVDPLRQRLLHVAEEMAIACALPVPEVHVLEQESGINAFAAGLNAADAAIAVSRGALELLDRAELQGVVAHEFSHILNGDMRLNTRLLGPLFGLTVLSLLARLTLFHLPRLGGRGRQGLFVLGASLLASAVLVIRAVGSFCGRLIQAAVSRQREYLADAAAVQFTRDPRGLRNALVKIGAALTGSRLVHPEAEEIAHLLFAPARHSALATHPALTARIRALDPGFDPAEFGALRRTLDRQLAARRQAAAAVNAPAAGATQPQPASATAAAALASGALPAQVGRPQRIHLEHAAAMRRSLPAPLIAASRASTSATALLFALGIDRHPEHRPGELAFVSRQLGEAVSGELAALLPLTDSLHPAQRLPLLFESLPALRRLPRAQREQLLRCLHMLLQRQGGQLAVHAYVLRKLAHTFLRDELDPGSGTGSLPLRAVREELRILFSIISTVGHDEPTALAAYRTGLGTLLGGEPPPKFIPPNWPARLDQALTRLDRLNPAATAQLVEALGRTVAHDGRLAIAEAELLRAVCAVLHCPLPALLATPAAAD